jgi:hypothetical protein
MYSVFACVDAAGVIRFDDSTPRSRGDGSSPEPPLQRRRRFVNGNHLRSNHRGTQNVAVRAGEEVNNEDDASNKLVDEWEGVDGTTTHAVTLGYKLKAFAGSEQAKTAVLGVLFAGWYLTNIAFNLYNKQARVAGAGVGRSSKVFFPFVFQQKH